MGVIKVRRIESQVNRGNIRHILVWMICLYAVLISISATAAVGESGSLDKVTLQLKWSHAFQFAGYYAAKEKGYYQEAGLDVSIFEAKPGDDPIEAVIEGRVEFGVGTSSLMIERSKGKPVVALAVIFQHSPYVLLARKEISIQSVHDLVGKRLMIEPQAEEILAYLCSEGVSLKKVTILEHSFDYMDLVNGKVDAISGYVINQPYYLDRMKFPYESYSPRSAGIDFYGDNLFTSEMELKSHPARVKAFREASLRGWRYAMGHQEEIVDLILSKYSRQNGRGHLLFEAQQMMLLIHPELIELGYMNPGRWRHIAETYTSLGMLTEDFSLKGFLYNPNPQRDLTWFYIGLASAILLILIVGAIALRFARISMALRESEEKFRILAETTTSGIYVVRGKRLLMVNSAIQKLTGYSRDELLSMDPFELAHPDFRDIFNERRMSRERGEDISPNLEFKIITRSGAERWLYLTSGVITFDGEPAVLGTVFDITERRRAEEALKSSEARFRSYFELPLVGISINSPTKGWLEVNDRICEILGYSRQELSHLTWAELTHPDDLAADVKQFDQLMAGEIDSYSMEKRYIRKCGDTVWASMSIGCVRNHDGKVDYTIALLRDITEHKLLEERLRQSEKMEAIGQLAGGIAHDFNNQLTGIMGYAEMLVSRLDDRKLRDYAENIVRASKRSADLTRDLLAFSRKGKYLTGPVHIHKVIEEVVSILEHSIDKRVEIKIILKANPATIMGDGSQIQNALLNLAINARDAMPNGGELVFTTENLKVDAPSLNPEFVKNCSGRCLKISVSDNGIGMDKDVMKHIFEPFFTTKEKGKGTGMGLASVYGIVQNHHGVINVSSEPGCGTVFSLYFPVSEDNVPQLSIVDDEVPISREATIMIVEDEEMVASMVSSILDSFGHKAIVCGDGVEAVELYRNTWKSIDLVILDMVMPKMSGKDVFLAMKEINPDVKAILASGFSIEGEAQCILELGAICFIQKPFDINELSMKISDVLGGKQCER